MTTTATSTRTRVARALVAGGALTAVAGFAVQAVVLPTTDVSEDLFSYPWTPEMLVPVSLVYAVLHGLVAVGLAQVARPMTGVVRGGLWAAVVGTVLLLAGELASLAVRDRLADDTTVGIVTGPLFGGGTLLTAIGLLVAGIASCRRRRTPFGIAVVVAGTWTLLLLALIMTPVMAAAIGVYGAALAAIGLTAGRA